MLKTCKYCGRVVDEDHKCSLKPERKKEDTKLRMFRNSKGWVSKSIEIRERDKYLCQVCLMDKYDSIMTFNFKKLEVHHIIPLATDFDKRLDNDNLITLCSYHHHLADKGHIPAEELSEIVKAKDKAKK